MGQQINLYLIQDRQIGLDVARCWSRWRHKVSYLELPAYEWRVILYKLQLPFPRRIAAIRFPREKLEIRTSTHWVSIGFQTFSNLKITAYGKTRNILRMGRNSNIGRHGTCRSRRNTVYGKSKGLRGNYQEYIKREHNTKG
ncbi:hypothetical protein CAPTEDRAFT_185965 [Capitella teleta]|uniref:Uncharacterized protein n=1 Tax=Capitella teleta TaxID=283909 RepID=R7VGN1_CAPTE|nr:hypothetical protein CAPTEDRAFT_185965 [Capitella teleta]|eukprot:ELU17759.1 hypothetical protein CAPTEDRAFT_185965 [Capitella teleta]